MWNPFMPSDHSNPAPPQTEPPQGGEGPTDADVAQAQHVLRQAGIPEAAITGMSGDASGLVEWAGSVLQHQDSDSQNWQQALADLESRLLGQEPSWGPQPQPGQPSTPYSNQYGQHPPPPPSAPAPPKPEAKSSPELDALKRQIEQQQQQFQQLVGLYEQDVISREAGRFDPSRRDDLVREAQNQIRAGRSPSEAFSVAAKILDVPAAGVTPVPGAPSESAPPAEPTALERLRAQGTPTPPEGPKPADATPKTPQDVAKKWSEDVEAAYDRGDAKAAQEIADAARQQMEDAFGISMI